MLQQCDGMWHLQREEFCGARQNMRNDFKLRVLRIRTGRLRNAAQQLAGGIELEYATVTVAVGYEELQEASERNVKCL